MRARIPEPTSGDSYIVFYGLTMKIGLFQQRSKDPIAVFLSPPNTLNTYIYLKYT